MAVQRGTQTKRLLEMHVTVSYDPLANSLEWQRAKGTAPLPSGRTGQGSEHSQEVVRRARERADRVIHRIAQDAAEQASEMYAKAGFPGLRAVVGPRTGGVLYPITVEGRDAQKYARILEGGSSGMPMDEFIRKARHRREIKTTREVNGKTRPRGKIDEREGGFYITVPTVLGRVSRTEAGTLKFDGARVRGRQIRLSATGEKSLEQFVATPAEEDYAANHDDPTQVSPFRTGVVTTEFRRRAPDPNDPQGQKRVQMELVVTPQIDVGNELWERVKYEQRVRKAGRATAVEGQKNPDYDRPTQDNPQTLRGGQARSNKRGFEAMRNLGMQASGQMLPNLRVNDPDADLAQGSASARAIASRQKGQVVSFRNLSTRSAGDKVVGKRPALHILAGAERFIRDQLREEIARARTHLSGRGGTFAERAYLETLESAAR